MENISNTMTIFPLSMCSFTILSPCATVWPWTFSFSCAFKCTTTVSMSCTFIQQLCPMSRCKNESWDILETDSSTNIHFYVEFSIPNADINWSMLILCLFSLISVSVWEYYPDDGINGDGRTELSSILLFVVHVLWSSAWWKWFAQVLGRRWSKEKPSPC